MAMRYQADVLRQIMGSGDCVRHFDPTGGRGWYGVSYAA